MGIRKKTTDLLGEPSPDLNSLLDVIFILLIFTILSMQVGKIQSMDLDVTQLDDKSAGIPKEDSVALYIYENRKVSIHGKSSDLKESKKINEDWVSNLKSSVEGKTVLILTEKKVNYEDFLYVLSKVKNLSPKGIELGVEYKKEQ